VRTGSVDTATDAVGKFRPGAIGAGPHCPQLSIGNRHGRGGFEHKVRYVKASILCSGFAALLVVVGGCGGGNDSERRGGVENPVDVAGSEDRASSEVVELYMEAVAEGSARSMDDALDFAAEGSVAEAYLIHQRGALVADQDAGYGSQTFDSSLDEIDDGFELCETLLAGDEACYEYTDFELDDDQVSGFKIDGRDLGDRIVVGDGASVPIGDVGSAKLLSAYQAASGNLFVVIEVSSGPGGLRLSDLYSSTYRSADGRQRSADVNSSVASDLGPESLANVAVIFPDTGRGGTFNAVFYGDDFLTEHVLSVPIP